TQTEPLTSTERRLGIEIVAAPESCSQIEPPVIEAGQLAGAVRFENSIARVLMLKSWVPPGEKVHGFGAVALTSKVTGPPLSSETVPTSEAPFRCTPLGSPAGSLEIAAVAVADQLSESW